MTAGHDVDHVIGTWLRDEASGPQADYLEETLAVLERVPQSRWGPARRALAGHARPIPLPRRISGVAVAAVLSLVLLAGLAVVGAERRAPLTGPAGNGLIGYGDGHDAFLVDPFGDQEPIKLPEALGAERNPTFSPDGTMVAYASLDPTFGHDGGPLHLFVVPADGSGAPLRISADIPMWDGNDVAPSWAPDGEALTYTGYDVATNTVGIVTARVDGTGVTMIEPFEAPIWIRFPLWSPDGRWIAYHHANDAIPAYTSIRIVSPAGGVSREVVRAPGSDSMLSFAWSPDSTKLVYERRRDGPGTMVVAVIDIDGARERVISPGSAVAKHPAWSTDGAWIAYLEDDPSIGAATRTVLVDPSGEQRRDLGVVLDCEIDWSPDSRFLLGLSASCVEPLVIVPVADPGAVMTIEPGGSGGTLSWQRREP